MSQPTNDKPLARMDEAMEVSQPCCLLCIHWHRRSEQTDQGNLGDCYLNPPVPTMVMQQHPISGQVMQGMQMLRPITRDTETCGYCELPGEAGE